PTMSTGKPQRGFGDQFGGTTLGRNPRQSTDDAECGDDDVIASPTCTLLGRRIAQLDRRATLHRKSFELAIREEPDPLAVRGEERIESALGAGKYSERGLIEQPRAELPPVRAADMVDEPSTVGRHDDRGNV